MGVNNALKMDKVKELDRIRKNTQKALQLLNLADYNAGELSNRNLLDHKQARVISTYFERAMDTTRELTEYLESLGEGVSMEKPKYINVLPASVKNRIVTVKLELAELAESVSAYGDKTLISKVETAITAVNDLDEYAWQLSG